MSSRLKELLETVLPAKTSIGQAQFVATKIPSFEDHFVGWNSAGQPCLLIKTTDNGFLAPLKLSALEAQFCIPCEIVLPKGTSERYQLTVVTCTSAENDLRDYFLHLMDTVIQIVGQRPSLHAVSEAIGKLVEILQQLIKPARRSVIGLFAEVMIIAVSRDPIKCVSAWRSSADDRFDFSLDDARLEVKATGDRIRSHYFSIEQCTHIQGTYVSVASMFVEQSGSGQSLGELLDEAEHRLGGDMQAYLKLQTVLANSLGVALPAALQMRFDSALARSTLAFFWAGDIPAIRTPIPRGVSSVRFRSDLTGVTPATIQSISQKCPALAHILPSSG